MLTRTEARSRIPEVGEGKRGEEGYVGYLLRQAAHAWRRRVESALAPLEMTHAQYLVLAMVRAYPGCSNADLARLTMLTPQSVHGIIVNVERRGLIERRPDAVHGRVQNIELSPDGRDLLSRARRRVLKLEAELQKSMDKGEGASIRRWLVRVAQDSPS